MANIFNLKSVAHTALPLLFTLAPVTNSDKGRLPSPSLVDFLMRVRPAQLGDWLKNFLSISRAEVLASTGCRYWIDPVSLLGVALVRSGVYEATLTHLLQRILRDGDTFVDVGANEGYFAALAGTLVGSGRVYAVEPQTRLQDVLRANLELNGLHNVQIEPLAISDQEGQAELLLRPSTNTGASSMFRHWKIGQLRERITTTTLDRFASDRRVDHIRLLKVDCEGAETLVFREASSVLSRKCVDFIALEFHPQIVGDAACRTIHELLFRHGYRTAVVNGYSLYHSPDVIPPAAQLAAQGS